MGCRISKEVSFIGTEETVLTYTDATLYSSAGYYKAPLDTSKGENVFETCTKYVYQNAIEKRKEVIAAKLKFKEMDVDTIKDRYPNWTESMILDLKVQFQAFDINVDGLIDFPELNHVLDELGDTSREPQRKMYFDELDKDHSGAIDFEEYLALIDAMLFGKSKMTDIAKFCSTGSENVQKLRQMTIVQQIDSHLL